MRHSGILMHISSLPGPYGIGTLGASAFEFVDFLKSAGQHYWQILPVGPTGYGDSPYQSFSAFAGNHYFIDLDLLIRQGLLLPEEAAPVCADDARVDYGLLYNTRMDVLRKAYGRFSPEDPEFRAFRERHPWLEDYCLFMALKSHFGGEPWTDWPEDIRRREAAALAHYQAILAEDIGFHRFLQFQFFRQWSAVHRYAQMQGIEIIGDIPIYVPLDSADVWASPESFQLGNDLHPESVAGVPPDSFSADGQLWGNPLYNWDAMAQDGFRWWLNRIGGNAGLFDVIRIDHFRGIESYWSVPGGSTTAKDGHWVKGPGIALIHAIQEAFPTLHFIAEDLGYLTPEVMNLVHDSGFPGMKILEFAFDSREAGNYLPHTYTRNCICYTGTHDNETLVQWENAITAEDRALARAYLGIGSGESLPQAMIRCGFASVADTFIVQMPDWLGLGKEARMNHPGCTDGSNWRWRCPADALTKPLAERILALTRLYHRDGREQ